MKKYIIIITAAVALVVLYFVFFYEGRQKDSHLRESPGKETRYRIDGHVYFIEEEGDTISKLYVEVADDYHSHARGLMHRFSMPDSVGMLFIYEDYNYRSFWMKNTHISLDLVFIDLDYRINQVHEYAIPYSEESIVSKEKAKYVIEVNAGYTDKHNINSGQSTILNLH